MSTANIMEELRVIKRDGRIKQFDISRIISALEKAYVDCGFDICKDDVKTQITNIAMKVLYTLESTGTKVFSVEDIQDTIVDILKKYNEVIANSYSEYRKSRTAYRESKLLTPILGLLDYTNLDVLNENANKQSQLISTQRDLMAGEVSKYISAERIIPKDLMKAHNKGIIKIHDLDYFISPSTNCELVNLKDMLNNGTVINKKRIHKPRSLRTAMTLATQIAAQVASCTYGGQTISLSHLAPYVRISKEKLLRKYNSSIYSGMTDYEKSAAVKHELEQEITDSVQTFNYQVSTLMTTNGQSPFISVCMYISEEPEYEEETVMLIEEFLKQRIRGMENEYDVIATQTFPKLLYFLDENNIHPDSKYYWLTELAAKSTALRMNPDVISVKKMKEVIGYAFPPMGCRAFLSPFTDENGDTIFYGRGNLGVCTVNLPYAALESNGDIDKFFEILDGYLEYVRRVGELRYNKLKGVKASVAPILWQHGAISRLNADDDIIKAINAKGFTVTMGYSGLYETVKYLTGESHTTKEGYELATKIMSHLKDKCDEFKHNQPHLRFALYGTPQESTTGWFNDKLKQQFGVIPDITDKGWITNSYHVDIREDIDAFSKLSIEAGLQDYSTGGAVSYVEVDPLSDNIDAVLELFKHMYDNIIYAEINFESDVCGNCKYEGKMEIDKDTLEWYCPQCGNRNQSTLSVVRRTCGYLGETTWSEGRKLDIINRVKHL